MRIQRLALSGLITTALALCAVRPARVGTTIDVVNRYAYGANIGWMDWHADGTNGAVIGNFACSGYIYSANVGWINLGSGSPTNGISYQNIASNDFGVNNAGVTVPGYFNLRGYAYGANIGWINFENNGGAAVSMVTGQLTGYAWSANCGWISVANAYAYVQTDTLFPGPLAPNGLPIPWLLTYFGTTNVNTNSDPNGTGMTVGQDYLAGVNPTVANSKLSITSETFASGGVSASVTWSSVPDRLYYVQKTLSLSPTNWIDSGLGVIVPGLGASTTGSFSDTAEPDRFYRVEAFLPLAP
jgi:hypothetical protein